MKGVVEGWQVDAIVAYRRQQVLSTTFRCVWKGAELG